MHDWQLEKSNSKEVIVQRLTIADGFWSRFCGLQFRRPLPTGHGIMLVPCSSIHTMWMRFAIDVAMLDRSGRVLAVARAVRPWRLAFAPRGTHAVLEVASPGLQLEVGDTVALHSLSGRTSPPRSLAEFIISPR